MAVRAPCWLLPRFRGCLIPGSTVAAVVTSTSIVDNALLSRRSLSIFSGSGAQPQSQRWSTRPSSSSSSSSSLLSPISTYTYHSTHTRTYTTPASPSGTMANQAQLSKVNYAAGEDVPQLESDVRSLVEDGGWVIDEEGMGVKKTFYFKGYFKAVSFLNFIAAESASKKHHAIMTLRIGSVDVYWTTHQPRGFTHKDVFMARHCDKGAELMGSVEPDQGQKCIPAERPK